MRSKEDPPICCDYYSCGERGEFPRCYLDIYKFCPKYEPKPCKKEREKRKNNKRA